MTSDKNDSTRITDLELALMHLQRDYDSLNEVVLENGTQIAKLTVMLGRLSTKVDSHDEKPVERKPEDEVPPHY